MSAAELPDDEQGVPFRDLFPEEEIHEFYRPVFQLPTRGIAIGSLVVSVLLAGALLLSARIEGNRPAKGPKPVPGSGKKRQIHPGSYPQNDTIVYFREPTPFITSRPLA